jgi:preprotein translocase subunit Sec61beta
MANQGLNVPSGMGGLMRYNEEYKSNFMLKPAHVILFLIATIALTFFLKIFF